MTKKAIALLLALVMLGGLLAGCSETKENTGADNTAAPGSDPGTAETAAETEAPDEASIREKVDDGLGEKDLDGMEFRVLNRDRSDFVADLSFEEELNGDVVNDAICARNAAVAERFNITLAADYVGEPVPIMESCVASGDDSYDVCLAQIIQQTAVCYKGGYFDWYTDIPHIDLTRQWYIGNAAEALSVKNHAYVMIGEFDLDVLRFTYCMYYNKNIAAEYNLDEIYGIVKEGKWTYDYLKLLADLVYEDLDGNGAKDESDRLALSGDPYSAVVTYQYAFDNPLFSLDTEGVPQMTFNREKANSIVEKLNALYWESSGSFTSGWGTGSTAWNAGRLLCYTGLFNSASAYRDLDFDFGIIPYPKYDEAQASYYTMSDGAHGGMMVPITVRDIDSVGLILEALNAETWKKVVPAYYDTSLKVKFSRDTESAEMLDLLMSSRVFDFGYMCGDWGMAFVIQDLVSRNSNDSESAYKSKDKMAQKTFGKIIDAYLALDEGN